MGGRDERERERAEREREYGNLASSKRDQRILPLFRAGAVRSPNAPSFPLFSHSTLSPPSISSPPHHPVSHRHAHQRLRDEKQGRPLPGPRSSRMAVWPFLPHLMTPAAPIPGLKVESVCRPTPLLRVPLVPKPWREYIYHLDKYPGGRVVRPLFIHQQAM